MSNIDQTAISNEATAVVNNIVSAPTETTITEQATPEAVAATSVESNSNDFLTGLGEELASMKALQNFKSAEDLAKSYINANQLLGKRVSELSPEDAAHLKSLQGVPKEVGEYALPEQLNGESAEWYKGTALKAGLTKDQAKVIADEFVMLERAKLEQIEKEDAIRTEQWVGELKKEFGSAFDKQIEVAKRGLKEFGNQEVIDILNRTGLIDNPSVVKMFAKIGKELLEDSIVSADKEAVFGITPGDALSQIEALRSNPEFMDAYFNRSHRGHQSAVEKMNHLRSKLKPN